MSKVEEKSSKYVESKELVLMGYSPEYIDDVKKDMSIAFIKGYEQAEKDLASDWTEDDERTRANLSSLLYNLRVGKKIEMETFEKYYNWLKTIHVKPRKSRKKGPEQTFEYPFDVPDNDGYLVFTPMGNQTIRKELKLKKGDRIIVSIRKEQ